MDKVLKLMSNFWIIILFILVGFLVVFLLKMLLFDFILDGTEIGKRISNYFKKRREIKKRDPNAPKIVLKFNDFVTYYALKPDYWLLKEKKYLGDTVYKYRFKGTDKIKYSFFILDLKKQKELLEIKKSEENFYECLKRDLENYKSKV